MGELSVAHQSLVLVLGPRGVDEETYLRTLEDQFSLTTFSRTIPAPDVYLYQSPKDGRRLTVQPNRLVFQDEPWLRELEKQCESMRSFCGILDIRIVASGVNPTFKVHFDPAEHAPPIVDFGERFARGIGPEGLALSAVEFHVTRQTGRVNYRVSVAQREPLEFVVDVNWHREHDELGKALERFRGWRSAVAELEENVRAAFLGERV